MLPRIMSFAKPHMDNLQFAYLPNRCTEDAVNTFHHELLQHLDKGSNYARCLFIDYSSAFNTMQPHILLDKLKQYDVPARLQLWILDFLTNRKQYVRTSKERSGSLTINTGAPQGCVLSAFLFIIYTNDMAMNSDSCKIIKYADDTIVLGLINKNNETKYREAIDYVTNWCSDNYLHLNVSKTKEMVFDFRVNQNTKIPVVIDDTDVTFVEEYKYLGVTIQNDLKWDVHINNQVKKANKRMYHVRCLRNLNVDRKIICLFYNSVISSVLTYAISTWFNACSEKLHGLMNKSRKRVCKIVGSQYHCFIDKPDFLYDKKCISLVGKIIKDCLHPLHVYFKFLPHGKRLRMQYSRTARFHDSFVPSSIKVYNSSL